LNGTLGVDEGANALQHELPVTRRGAFGAASA
jgi:hypothetical protein